MDRNNKAEPSSASPVKLIRPHHERTDRRDPHRNNGTIRCWLKLVCPGEPEVGDSHADGTRVRCLKNVSYVGQFWWGIMVVPFLTIKLNKFDGIVPLSQVWLFAVYQQRRCHLPKVRPPEKSSRERFHQAFPACCCQIDKTPHGRFARSISSISGFTSMNPTLLDESILNPVAAESNRSTSCG